MHLIYLHQDFENFLNRFLVFLNLIWSKDYNILRTDIVSDLSINCDGLSFTQKISDELPREIRDLVIIFILLYFIET